MPRLAVLGRPVSHSRSPAIQNAALAELGLAGEWRYEAIEVAPERFEPLVRSRALVLGAGGSGRACVWALTRAGAQVSIWNRTEAKAQALAAEFGATALSGQRTADSTHFDLLINATTVGLTAANADPKAGAQNAADLKALPIAADAIHEGQIVVDLVYGSAPTPLAAAAGSRGARVIDGLEVLVHQGAASLRIWTGLEPPLETMRKAAREA